MQLTITLDGTEKPEDVQRMIDGVNLIYGLVDTVALRIPASAFNSQNAKEAAVAMAADIDPATIGFGADTPSPGASAPPPAMIDGAAAPGTQTATNGDMSAATATPAAPDMTALDKAGLPYDPRIHSGSKTMNKGDGLWKKKKGVQDALVKTVEAELRAIMAIPGPAGSVPPPPSAQTNANAAPPPPGANTAPPPPGAAAPAPPPPPGNGKPQTFPQLMKWLTPLLASNKITQPQVTATLVSMNIVDASGVGQLSLLAPRPDLVEGVYDLLYALTVSDEG